MDLFDYTTKSEAPESNSTLSISQFLDRLNNLLFPVSVTIQGEITSFVERGRAVYFTLSDKKDKAVLSCLVWTSRLRGFGVELKEGIEVQVRGNAEVYKPSGRLNFMVSHIAPVGAGALQAAFEKLKHDLEMAGYFDPSRKPTVPGYAKRIGLITSAYGDARKDFVTHLGKHGFEVLFFDARVEGLQSIDSIVTAFSWFNTRPDPVDVIVITRGGGSLESLQSFNSRDVADAIIASRIPVVSAVGHENDITIADLVASVRASTPTHAGKLLSDPWRDLPEVLQRYNTALYQVAASRFRGLRDALSAYRTTYGRKTEHLISSAREQLTSADKRMMELLLRQIETTRMRVSAIKQHLAAADPEQVLKRGFSITRTQDGTLVRSVQDAPQDTQIKTVVADGEIKSLVEDCVSK